ncbi:hypothetical protein E3N88_04293 [Mikania micrantha]|uniref:Uncharacterized protein n=1 Tax=Mikania micrantha TaxID=192012 RepID=A0A5N6PU27_9ASTR|nr:hypothetical protein E3N88_04293 [Mikania micrantha]
MKNLQKHTLDSLVVSLDDLNHEPRSLSRITVTTAYSKTTLGGSTIVVVGGGALAKNPRGEGMGFDHQEEEWESGNNNAVVMPAANTDPGLATLVEHLKLDLDI